MKKNIINSAKAGVSLGVCTVVCYVVVAVSDIAITKGVAIFKNFKKKRHERKTVHDNTYEFVNDDGSIDEFTIEEEEAH